MYDPKDVLLKTCKRYDSTVTYKTYHVLCDDCGRDYQLYKVLSEAKKHQRCSSCAAKKRFQDSGNPMSGKKHTNLEKFRPHYSNVDYSDFTLKTTIKGKQKRHYRMSCKTCGKDRGYLIHSEAKRNCLMCHTKKQTKRTREQTKIYKSMGCNINLRLKHRNAKNSYGSFRFLPYTIEDLMVHLSSQFEPWMTWENHGAYNPDSQIDPSKRTWQIDHIIADCHFFYTSPLDEGFKQSWALSNLRPLEAKANIYKSWH